MNKTVTLTKQQSEVLKLAAEGHGPKDIAGVLFISKRTVDFHLATIYDKLGVNNRIMAINTARALGLI